MESARMKMFVAAAGAVGWAACALAADWTGNAGNFQLDDAANWSATPTTTTWCYVKTRPAQPFTVGGDGDYFGGAMLRYTGSFAATNDFGAGAALTNVGLKAESAVHVESGAKLVQKSGGIRGFKGTKYDGTYISNTSSFTLDGADTWFEQKTGSFTLRSTVSGNTVFPNLFVTNGASLTVGDSLNIGGGEKNVSAYVCAAGEGTRVEANYVSIGVRSNTPEKAITNLLVIADSATAAGNRMAVGWGSSFAACEVMGGTMTISEWMTVGSRVASASNCWVRVCSGGTFTNQGTTVIGRAEAGNCARVVVSGEGSSFVGKNITAITGGVFRVEGGGAVKLQEALSLGNARIEASGSGSDFSVSKDVTARGTNVTFSATDGASITVPRLSVQNAVVEGALNYNRIYTEVSGGELVFTNATVSGTRIEMTAASTIRLYNTHLTIPSGIFMMGDASGGNAGNNANERHVYVGGTDTWVKVTQDNGFYVRGSNTTIHVEIPAEGFSKAHPVFDLPRISFESSRHVRIAVTVDPKLVGKGGSYWLFRTSTDESCHSVGIDWIYDPEIIDIDKSVSKELHIRVKQRGVTVIVR